MSIWMNMNVTHTLTNIYLNLLINIMVFELYYVFSLELQNQSLIKIKALILKISFWNIHIKASMYFTYFFFKFFYPIQTYKIPFNYY